jgi:hypothetical protein
MTLYYWATAPAPYHSIIYFKKTISSDNIQTSLTFALERENIMVQHIPISGFSLLAVKKSTLMPGTDGSHP